MRIVVILSLAFMGFLPVAYAQSDAEIREAIIRQSVQSYPGNCPCPYNKDRAGRNCGKRSAYSREGGYSVICFPSDVSEQMVLKFIENNKNQR